MLVLTLGLFLPMSKYGERPTIDEPANMPGPRVGSMTSHAVLKMTDQGQKSELLLHGISRASERLHDAGNVCTASESLTYGTCLGELLWWQISYREFQREQGIQVDPDAKHLAQAVRHSRNALAHGDQPWEAAGHGLGFPIRFPVTFKWNWRALPKPPKNPRWIGQWEQYSELLVGRDIERSLAEHRSQVLGL